jgi:hypothetical protein
MGSRLNKADSPFISLKRKGKIMLIGFISIDKRFHAQLAETALKLSEESPVREFVAKGEGYVVRVNDKHPAPELRGVYLFFMPIDIFTVAPQVFIVSREVARQMNQSYINEFGTPFPNFTD